MGKPPVLLLLIAVVVAGWFALQQFEVRGLHDLKFVRRGETSESVDEIPADAARETIRIATFNIQNLGPAKTENLAVMDALARIIRQFDLVAIQEVCSPRPDVLRSLLDSVNQSGRHYSILVGPPVGRTTYKEQYVYVYDQATLETDRPAAYTVDDPEDLLHRPPFVGWFRARGPASDQAFTFTLANMHVDPDEVAFESQYLDAVYYAVRDDGRGEDDLILLGDFNASDRQLSELMAIPNMLAAVSETPTNTRQTEQYDNLYFQLSATREYAGRSGVYDFMREFNLTLEQALKISDHLPVWAEFSVVEGGTHPAVAGATPITPRR